MGEEQDVVLFSCDGPGGVWSHGDKLGNLTWHFDTHSAQDDGEIVAQLIEHNEVTLTFRRLPAGPGFAPLTVHPVGAAAALASLACPNPPSVPEVHGHPDVPDDDPDRWVPPDLFDDESDRWASEI